MHLTFAFKKHPKDILLYILYILFFIFSFSFIFVSLLFFIFVFLHDVYMHETRGIDGGVRII